MTNEHKAHKKTREMDIMHGVKDCGGDGLTGFLDLL